MKDLNDTEARIRQQLEAARTAKGLTHAALAAQLGVNPPNVTAVLTRDRGRIPQSLIDLAEQLDLEVALVPRKRR